MKLAKWLIAALSVFSLFSDVSAASKQLNVYNWSQYIAPSVVPEFEKSSKIQVVYDVFDTNEILLAKMLSGQSGYDVVVPSNDFVSRGIHAGALLKLDKSKLPNWKYLDKDILKKLEVNDPGNQYSVPYMIDITGIVYNPALLKKALGKLSMPEDKWELLFNPVYAEKLSSCGIAFLDSPTEVFASALLYKGIDPNTATAANYQEAKKIISAVRPFVRYFDSTRYLSDLANGNICIALGWNGDAFMANKAAKQAKKDISVTFITPKKGALMSFDMLTIPKDAKNYDNALTFINYMLSPEVMAKNTGFTFYGNAVPASKKYLPDAEIINNKAVYPDADDMQHLIVPKPLSLPLTKLVTRLWSEAKSGN
ncbi:MAG: extracellular solute-binding protein [Endozoicomonadaceae bacterium]|nr:extracellular solute-binding protein [Endozoicomonadaceae bacterium]